MSFFTQTVKSTIILAVCLWGNSYEPILAYSKESLDDKKLRAILGEAEGESYHGKLALAYAINNRGSIRGVYGYNAIILRSDGYYRHNRRLSKKVVVEALKALEWANSHPDKDLTFGATSWENIKAFKVPYWASSMTETARIGNHVFYREKNTTNKR